MSLWSNGDVNQQRRRPQTTSKAPTTHIERGNYSRSFENQQNARNWYALNSVGRCSLDLELLLSGRWGSLVLDGLSQGPSGAVLLAEFTGEGRLVESHIGAGSELVQGHELNSETVGSCDQARALNLRFWILVNNILKSRRPERKRLKGRERKRKRGEREKMRESGSRRARERRRVMWIA